MFNEVQYFFKMNLIDSIVKEKTPALCFFLSFWCDDSNRKVTNQTNSKCFDVS